MLYRQTMPAIDGQHAAPGLTLQRIQLRHERNTGIPPSGFAPLHIAILSLSKPRNKRSTDATRTPERPAHRRPRSRRL
jgi:hypothetical protein